MDSPQGETKPLFDEDLFNDNVLRQIKELQDTESGRFSVLCDELVFRDIPLLLKIIIEACLGSHAISEEECGSHLTRNMQLGVELIQAYKDKSFVDVLYSDNMPSEIVQFAEDNPRGGLQVSSSHETLKSAFETPYIGDTHELLIKMLNQELKARRESAAERPYNLSVAVIQSSGMGKSRMLEEVGNEVFALITNIREDLPTHKTTYPPVDLPLRTYFEGLRGKSDYEQQADCAVLQRVQCDKLVKLTERHFRGQTGKQLAGNFAKHMKEESTEKAVGPNRKRFFEDVVKTTITLREGRDKDTPLDELIALMKESCKNLVNTVHPDRPVNMTACIVCFDEAHALTQVVEPLQPLTQETPLSEARIPTVLADQPKRSVYHNLGKVLSYLVEQPIFFIFLSTNSHLHDFAPAPAHFPSTRVTGSSSLIPPFTLLPFDIFVDQVLETPPQFTLANLCTTEVMAAFGRALWHTQLKSDPDASIFNIALDKLTCDGVPEHKMDSNLAALGVRIGIKFDNTTLVGRDLDSRLVESHMRIVYSIPRHREHMHTGSPSEPILAEAAARHLNQEPMPGGLRGIAHLAPSILSDACVGGFLARGERGELVARLLVTIAHDMAAQKHYDSTLKLDREAFNQPQYHCPIPLLDFLRALFRPEHHLKVLRAKPICQENANKSREKTLEEAFAQSYISFSHFALAGDSGMLAGPCLTTALARGMAIQAMDGQRSIDAVIPVHMGPPTTVISAQGTSAINLQVKNRKDVRSCPVDRSITIPDTSKPVISIIFELGCEQRGVRVIDRPHTTEEDPRQNDLHYEIVVYGYKSTELGVVPLEQEHMYRAILGGGSAVDDLPHRDDGMGSLEAFHNLKPAFYSHQQLKQFAGLIEGVEAPKGDPKKQPQRKTMEPTKEGPKTRRQSRALGVPTEEPKTRRQLGAPVAPGEEPKKKRAPEAEKSQPGPSKKRQKNK